MTLSRRLLGLCLVLFILQVQAQTPVGTWKTIDDHTKQPASIVKLFQHKGMIYGRIIKIFAVNGNKPTDLCRNCPGKLHNRPIQGMVFLWQLKPQQSTTWGDGKILDPKTGSMYHCKVTLLSNGHKLAVRGYIGIPLLGRTQIWQRLA